MLFQKISFALLGIFLIGCQNSEDTIQPKEANKQDAEPVEVSVDKGYELMAQKCFICHFETVDDSKMDNLIAPPMVRIQEHYKPNYATREAFVEAITEWVLRPNVDHTLMPGAVRKFEIMPVLSYDKKDLEIISATLYDMDFEDISHRSLHGGVILNNGEKWKVTATTLAKIDAVIIELAVFESTDLSGYNQLGRSVFDNSKMILLEDGYSDELFDQLHHFFGTVEGNLHLLVSAKTIDEAKTQQTLLKHKFTDFHTYFEE